MLHGNCCTIGLFKKDIRKIFKFLLYIYVCEIGESNQFFSKDASYINILCAYMWIISFACRRVFLIYVTLYI